MTCKGYSYGFHICSYKGDTSHPHKWHLRLLSSRQRDPLSVCDNSFNREHHSPTAASHKTHNGPRSSAWTPAYKSRDRFRRMCGCQHRCVCHPQGQNPTPSWGCWDIKILLTGRSGFEVHIEIPSYASFGPLWPHRSPLITWYVSFHESCRNFFFVVHCLTISSLPLHSFVLVRPKYTKRCHHRLGNCDPHPSHTDQGSLACRCTAGVVSYCTWGLHSDISEARKRKEHSCWYDSQYRHTYAQL